MAPKHHVLPNQTRSPVPAPSSNFTSTAPLQTSARPITPPTPTIASAGPSKMSPRAKPALTSAEAYAHANQPQKRRLKQNETTETPLELQTIRSGAVLPPNGQGSHPMQKDKSDTGAGKPLFDWISRKLGAGRRATIAEPSTRSHTNILSTRHDNEGNRIRYPSLPKNIRHHAPPPPLPPLATNLSNGAGPSRANYIPQSPDRASSMTRTESQALSAYAGSSERRARRELNNPYPSMPVSMYRGSIMSASTEPSISFLTRSRTPSLRSERSVSSSLRPRISINNDGNDLMRTDTLGYENVESLRRTGGADENASIRPLPPSHPGSPSASQNFSRSTSTSLLSPRVPRPSTPPTSVRRSEQGHRSTSSFVDSYEGTNSPGRVSRQDSTSTKPTTILSFDSGPHVAHIAQALPLTATSTPTTIPVSTFPSALNSPSSPLSPISPPTSGPASMMDHDSSPGVTIVQAPRHTPHHPIFNPHPLSPPDDNASTLTLASSTFAFPPPGSTSNHPLSSASLAQQRTSLGGGGGATGRLSTGSGPQHSGTNSISGPGGPSNSIRQTGGLGTSPSVTWAPDLEAFQPTPNSLPTQLPHHRPASLAPSILSNNTHEKPSSLFIARGDKEREREREREDKEYPSSLHPTLGTRGTGGGWSSMLGARSVNERTERADEKASVRALRRKGSVGSIESFESRWSWRGTNPLGNPISGATSGGGVSGSPLAESSLRRNTLDGMDNYSMGKGRAGSWTGTGNGSGSGIGTGERRISGLSGNGVNITGMDIPERMSLKSVTGNWKSEGGESFATAPETPITA